MTDRTSEALEASITKWEGYVEVEWVEMPSRTTARFVRCFAPETQKLHVKVAPGVSRRLACRIVITRLFTRAVDAWDDWLE